METSLIGKALDFGSNEYGFESHVSNINPYFNVVYVINHINLNIAKKNYIFKINFNKKNLKLIKVFKHFGLINNYNVSINNNKKYFINIYVYFYKNTSAFKKFKTVSTPSKKFYISYISLRLFQKRSGSTTLLLSTDDGYIDHNEAIKLKKGGLVVGLF